MITLLHSFGAKIFAVVSGVALLFFGAHVATPPEPSPQSTTATVVTQIEEQTSGDATTTATGSGLVLGAATDSTGLPQGETTVVNQYITQPIIERIVQTASPTISGQYVTHNEFATKFNELSSKMGLLVYGNTYPAPPVNYGSGGLQNQIALTNKIDQLTGTSLSGITVSGVSGLTDADIPDDVTAGNYLALSGGILAGDLSVTGNFTVAGAQTLSGAITIPYLDATSTTATSTFAGGMSAAHASLSAGLIVSGGNVGIGTTSPAVDLDIYSNSSDTQFSMTGTYSQLNLKGISDVSGVAMVAYGNSATTHNNINANAARGTESVPLPINSGDKLLTIRASGWNGTRFNNGSDSSAEIAFTADENFTSTSNNSAMIVFSTLATGDTFKTTRMTIKGNGNVGIGTTSPYSLLNLAATTGGILTISRTDTSVTADDMAGKLQFYADDTSTDTNIIVADIEAQSTNTVTTDINPGRLIFRTTGTGVAVTPTERMRITENGNVGVGTTSPWGRLSISATSTATLSNLPLFVISSSTASATSTAFIVDKNGNVGIASTSPWRTLSVTGTAALSGLTAGAGAGALCLTAGKEVVYSDNASCTGSSLRFKHDIVSLDITSGIAEALKLNPVSFLYNDDIGVKGEQIGFIAEEVALVDTRLVTYDASGTPSNVKYTNMVAVAIKAIQEMWASIVEIKDKVAGFAERLVTKELCVGNACVTEAQFQALLNQAGQQPARQSQPTTQTESSATPPTESASTTAESELASTTPATSETPEQESSESTTEVQPDAAAPSIESANESSASQTPDTSTSTVDESQQETSTSPQEPQEP